MDRGAALPQDGRELGTDAALMVRMARGDRRALDALYARHGGLACALAVRMIGERNAAEDAVQDAFVALWRRAADFDPARCATRTWLLAIVRNRCIDELRRRAIVAKRTTELDEQPAAIDHDPWPETWKRVCGTAIRGALAELPPEQREVGRRRATHRHARPLATSRRRPGRARPFATKARDRLPTRSATLRAPWR